MNESEGSRRDAESERKIERAKGREDGIDSACARAQAHTHTHTHTHGVGDR